MKKIKDVVRSVAVFREGDNPVYGDSVAVVEIHDEAAGPFIKLKQSHDQIEFGVVRLDCDELQHIAKIATSMVADYEKVLKPDA